MGGGRDRGRAVRACLNLIDLAGSERVSSACSMLSPAHMKELSSINKSLSCLASCIAHLSTKGGAGGHVPYRDSLLTRLLQNSLGGNSRTVLLATVSPDERCVDETLSTLRFADRAKRVVLRAVPNAAGVGETLEQQRKRFEVGIQGRAGQGRGGSARESTRWDGWEGENGKRGGRGGMRGKGGLVLAFGRGERGGRIHFEK